ncbi:MAG: PaaI family thioesterase [Burkholderiales bacterium]
MDFGGGVEIPFVNHLGFELVLFEGGRSEIRYAPAPEHLNSFAVLHGGAVMTLLDVTMAVAARSARQDSGIVTIEMKTSFLLPAKGAVVGKGHLLHSTTKMAFAEGKVYDAEGRLCAHSTGTFKYVQRAPAAAKAESSGRIATD